VLSGLCKCIEIMTMLKEASDVTSTDGTLLG